MEYKIMAGNSMAYLQDKVNEAIENGWRLQGGIATHGAVRTGGAHGYVQAMVRDGQWTLEMD